MTVGLDGRWLGKADGGMEWGRWLGKEGDRMGWEMSKTAMNTLFRLAVS